MVLTHRWRKLLILGWRLQRPRCSRAWPADSVAAADGTLTDAQKQQLFRPVVAGVDSYDQRLALLNSGRITGACRTTDAFRACSRSNGKLNACSARDAG